MPPNNSPYPQAPQQGAPQPGQAPGTYGVPQQPGQMPQQPMQQMPQQGFPQSYPGPQGQPQNGQQQPQPPKNQNSTQNTLQLSEIRDSMVIMNDGTYRAVIACKSINFDLMSDREREGVEYSYQNFLNSLTFPVQILVRSQRVDIGPYIEKLIGTRRSQDNMLLGVLMDDYINFIDILSQEANIMEKSFYITVPYYPNGDGANLLDQGKGFFGKLFAQPQNKVTKIDTATYTKAKDEIKRRVDTVTSGLFQMGVQSVQLDTRALGELYYNYYNPDTAVRQPLGDFENISTTFVKKGVNPQTQQGGVQ